jgi:histidinol-phosphate phosphatase family protein
MTARGGGADTTIVIPTVGRESLSALLDSLDRAAGRTPPVVVVDDRPEGAGPALSHPRARVVRSGGRGPAAARNRGRREARTPWLSFLDDDVLVTHDWLVALEEDLATAGPDVVAVQGRVRVPLPSHRRPLDSERGTAGLESAQWITADMTVRRTALRAVGGFDERFRKAYREDADLGLRLSTIGRVVPGRRVVLHPVRADGDWFSVRQQRGNADDVLMRRLHGPDWRARCGAPPGTLRRHRATVGAAVASGCLALGRRRRAGHWAAAAWMLLTARFAWERIEPGPRTLDEVRRMLLTSVVVPFAAVGWWLTGLWRHRRVVRRDRLPDLVLLDRDGTLVHDVPYNADPRRVVPLTGAVEALDLLRDAGIRTGIASNQSGVARGLISPAELEAVNQRVEELLGPFDTVQVCVHGLDDGCECRKPRPGLVLRACDDLDVDPSRCVVVGDIGADVEAAIKAGATGVLVPTAATLDLEVEAASRVEPDLLSAARRIIRGDW